MTIVPMTYASINIAMCAIVKRSCVYIYVCKCEKMIQVQQAAEAPTYSPCFPVQGLVPVCPGSL